MTVLKKFNFVFIFIFIFNFSTYSQIFDFDEKCLDEVFILNFTTEYIQKPEDYIYGKYCIQKRPLSFRFGIGSTYQVLNGSFGDWYNNPYNFNIFLTVYHKKWLINFEIEGLETKNINKTEQTLILEPINFEIGHINANFTFGRVFEFKRNYFIETFLGINARTFDFSRNQNLDSELNGKIRYYTPIVGARFNKFWQFRNGNFGLNLSFKYFPSTNSTINNQMFNGDLYSFGLGISTIGFFTKKRFKTIENED